jgi:hypothetical protein
MYALVKTEVQLLAMTVKNLAKIALLVKKDTGRLEILVQSALATMVLRQLISKWKMV